MMQKRKSMYVAVKTEGVVEIHLPHSTGNYATLCGLDGDDAHPNVNQKLMDVPSGAKVNCEECRQIFITCRSFSLRDFEKENIE